MILQTEETLFYMEPEAIDKSKSPIEDDLTSLVEMALKDKKATGTYDRDCRFHEGSTYRGYHTTSCGQHSSSNDYLLANGMVTNSLAVFYTKFYRDSILSQDRENLKKLASFYGKDIDWDNAFQSPAPDALQNIPSHCDGGTCNESTEDFDEFPDEDEFPFEELNTLF